MHVNNKHVIFKELNVQACYSGSEYNKISEMTKEVLTSSRLKRNKTKFNFSFFPYHELSLNFFCVFCVRNHSMALCTMQAN